MKLRKKTVAAANVLFVFILLVSCKQVGPTPTLVEPFASATATTTPVTLPVSFANSYGGINDDTAYSLKKTSDGEYIMAGTTQSFGSSNKDVYLLKVDDSGGQTWFRNINVANADTAYDVQQTPDGGYIIVGKSYSFLAGDGNDALALKTDSSGAKTWSELMGGTGEQCAYAVVRRSNGDYILVGESITANHMWSRWIVTASGSFSSGSGSGTSGVCVGRSAWMNSDGLIICAGLRGGQSHVEIMNEDLSIGWWSTVDGRGSQHEAYSVQQTTDGGHIVTGHIGPGYGYSGFGNEDVYLLKLDAWGQEEWFRSYGGAGRDYGRWVRQTADGGYIVAGYTTSFGASGYDVYLIKADNAGNQEWYTTFGGAGHDYGYAVQQAADGGYMICGTTNSFGFGGVDVYLIRTGAY